MTADELRLYRIAAAIIGAVTLIRVVVLILSPLNFYPDEAQYWFWAQTPALGYFSKPPMIGWIVWTTTAVFGNAEWAVRLGAPLLHGCTALLVFGIGRQVSDARVAFWSALAYLTLPGISYSSGLISTDVPLLFFWALALYAFLRAMDEADWCWPLICGAALGLGMLSKYAMAYFVLGAIVAAVFSPKARRVVLSLRGLVILVLGFAILFPNIWWNAQNHFATVSHTQHNADWSHARFDAMGLLGFLGGQFGVFGPILMVGLVLALWRLARGLQRAESDLTLAAFCVPPLLVICIQAFISEANANWAATAYISAVPLAVAVLLRLWYGRALWTSFALHSLAMLVLWGIYLSPAFADSIGLGNAFKRMEGWRAEGQQVAAEASRGGYDAIVADNRSVIAELLYYAQPRRTAVLMWVKDNQTRDHFQMTQRFTPAAHHVLLVTEPSMAPMVLATFDSHAPVRTIVVPVGGHHTRITPLYDARDYRGPQAR